MSTPNKGKQIELLDPLHGKRASYVELTSRGGINPGALLGNSLPDGRGLYLFMTPNGAKNWRFDYRFPKAGKRYVLIHGSYPDVSLAEATNLHSEARLKDWKFLCARAPKRSRR